MNDLKLELQKAEYIGLTDAEALAALPAQVTKVGRIQDDNKLDLLTLVITNDLIDRLGNSMVATDTDLGVDATTGNQYRKVAKILREAFNPSYILSDLYRINLGLADIRTMFDGGLALGLITQDEYDALILLASYQDGVDFTGYVEADVAQARLETSLYVDTLPVLIGYPQLDSALDYAVVLSNKNVQFAVILDVPAAVDTKIDVFVHTDYSDSGVYETKGLKVGYILIKQGDNNGSISINKPLSRKIQASAISNIACNYNLIVKAL